jgi:hypothetical protein
MSESVSSAPPVGGPPLMYPVPPVTPVIGKPAPLAGAGEEPVRAATAQGVGQHLDMLV